MKANDPDGQSLVAHVGGVGERRRPEAVGVALGVGVVRLAVRARRPAALGGLALRSPARGRRAGRRVRARRPNGVHRGEAAATSSRPLRVSRSKTWTESRRRAVMPPPVGAEQHQPVLAQLERPGLLAARCRGPAASPSAPVAGSIRAKRGQSWSMRGPSRKRTSPSSVTPSKYWPLSRSRFSLVYDASTR